MKGPSFRLGMALVLAYRLEVVVAVVSAVMVTVLNWSLWTAIFQGRTEVVGRTVEELTTYVVVAWLITTFYGTRVDEELGRRFRDGQIAVDLLRPWDLQTHLYFRELGRSALAFVLTTAPLFIVAFLGLPLRFPTHASTILLFLVSLFLAQAVSFGIAWHVGILSFRMGNTTGLLHLKATILALFSGALFPLDVYPEGLRAILLWLPFHALSHVPANLFVERASPSTLVLPAVWALVLWATGRWAFHRSMRRLVIQGG